MFLYNNKAEWRAPSVCISKVVMIIEGVKLSWVYSLMLLCPLTYALLFFFWWFKWSETPAGTKFKQLNKQYSQIFKKWQNRFNGICFLTYFRLICYYFINTHAHSLSSLFCHKTFLGIVLCTLYSHVWFLFASEALLGWICCQLRRSLNYFWSTWDCIHGCCWFMPALLGNQPRESKTLGHMWKLTLTLYFESTVLL